MAANGDAAGPWCRIFLRGLHDSEGFDIPLVTVSLSIVSESYYISDCCDCGNRVRLNVSSNYSCMHWKWNGRILAAIYDFVFSSIAMNVAWSISGPACSF